MFYFLKNLLESRSQEERNWVPWSIAFLTQGNVYAKMEMCVAAEQEKGQAE